jgi:hypothetical protein
MRAKQPGFISLGGVRLEEWHFAPTIARPLTGS